MSRPTNPALLNRLRSGADTMAWNEFLGIYWPVVFSYARHRGCSEHTAEEVVQDVMLKVFEKRDVFCYDPAQGRFRNWLHRIVNNRVAERRRGPAERVRARGSDSNEGLAEFAGQAPQPNAAWDDSFDKAVLAAMIQVLRREANPRDFVAFELTAIQDRPPAEVARLTGMSRNMVYKARRKLMERLRQLAGDYANEGHLCDKVRESLQSLPNSTIERSLTGRVAKTMGGRSK